MQQKIKNAGRGSIIEKTKRKLRGTWVFKLRSTRFYPYFYVSYWHSKLKPFIGRNECADNSTSAFFAARPNPGAGIGHQMANWIAGYWFAKEFNLKFAHIPFSNKKWEDFFGFRQGEVMLSDLRREGFKVRRIPLFDEYNSTEVERIKYIIASYAGDKIVFLAEQDQFYHDQFGVIEDLQNKFYSASARRNDRLVYKAGSFNIAIHVRRGDIMEGDVHFDPEWAKRYQGNDYFVNALRVALEYCKDKTSIHIYLFSQGEQEDFQEFSEFPNLHFCLDMDAQSSFLHMVYADVLITSKSSFSYKPALLNKGVKFCPADFWHGYPESADWILLDERGKVTDAN